MGWNPRHINSCHPECSLTVTTKSPSGDCECKQLLKLHKWDCVAVHRSGLHTVDTSPPFQTQKRCSFVGVADASPLPLPRRAQCTGECREANAELLCSLFTTLSRPCFSINSRVCRGQDWRLFCGVLCCCIIPIRLRCQQVTRDRHFCYCDRRVTFVFPVAQSALSREITASALCQVLIPLKSVTQLQLTSVGQGFKQHHVSL